MAQVENDSAPADAVSEFVLRRRGVARFIVSLASSMAGATTFILTAPAVNRIAAVDPALEAFYFALTAVWFWSLARMWSLTLLALNRR